MVGNIYNVMGYLLVRLRKRQNGTGTHPKDNPSESIANIVRKNFPGFRDKDRGVLTCTQIGPDFWHRIKSR